MSEKEALLAKVEAAIDQLRPFLEADGGNIELLDITDDNVVQVKFLGACKSCSMSAMTLKAGVEESIKRAAPQIVSVVALEVAN
jgi:Fe-S cluster biogenesis protein NfuA